MLVITQLKFLRLYGVLVSEILAFEINNRLDNLKKILQENGLDAALIVQNVDLFYFSGTFQHGILFVPSIGEPFLFIKKVFDRAKSESPIKKIYPFKSLNDISSILSDFGYHPKAIGVEMDVLPVNLCKRYTEVFSGSTFFDFSFKIRKIRMQKSPYEVEKIKESARLIDELFDEIKPYIKEGLREIDVEFELEYLARKKGHAGLVRMRAFNQEMFYGHLLSGETAFKTSYVDSPTGGEGQGVYFPQGASKKTLKKNEPFSVDFVFSYEGYLVDMTRIFYLGKPPEHYLKVYDVAKEIHKTIREKAYPGMLCSELFLEVMKIVERNNLKDIFMGPKGKTVPYIGHGVGLELDELPILTIGSQDRIFENTVFALEPKFFVPSLGIAGIESTYIMTNNGLLLLTKYADDIQII